MLSDLPPDLFESLCLRLLIAEGYRVSELGIRGRASKFDFKLSTPRDAKIWAVEVVRVPKNFGSLFMIRQAISKIDEAKTAVPADKYLIITNATKRDVRARISVNHHPDIELWFKEDLEVLLAKHPDIERRAQNAFRQLEDFQSISVDDSIEETEVLVLRKRLETLPSGMNHWREYEDLCIDLLTFLFVPPLKTPKIQSISEDGLDRRDAIFSLGENDNFWSTIEFQFRTRLVVAEFKNYTEPVEQAQVESTRDYLYTSALRSVALLCSRKLPSESALKARRRAWQESQKLILFLSDEDLLVMLAAKTSGGCPTAVLDDQIDAFFRDLCP